MKEHIETLIKMRKQTRELRNLASSLFKTYEASEEALSYAITALQKIDEGLTAEKTKVAKCKDCKYFYCLSAIDRRFYCQHQSGLKLVQAIEKDSYCSYGEPKESKR